MSAEHGRLEEARTPGVPWRKWGPYLWERQWGTVREDYSDSGDARAMPLFATSTGEQFLELGKGAGFKEVEPASSGQAGGTASSLKP